MFFVCILHFSCEVNRVSEPTVPYVSLSFEQLEDLMNGEIEELTDVLCIEPDAAWAVLRNHQ